MTSNTTSSWRKHGMVWLVHPTLPTWRFGFKQIQCHQRHVSHPSQRQALWWRLTQMLCNRDPGCQAWKDRCSWCHERSHSSKCTSKNRLALSATGEQKDVWWNSKHLSTLKGTHWHWSKCQACAFYASSSTLNPFEDYQKGRQQSTLDQQLASTEQSHKMQAISIANNHGYFAQVFWGQVFH